MLRFPSLRDLDRGLPGRVWLCAAPVDMRCGFDALSQVARRCTGRDVMAGGLFVFIGKRRERLKVLYWDADGFAVWYKRLEVGTLRLPRVPEGALSVELCAAEFAMLLEGIDLRSIKRRKRFEWTYRPAGFASESS